jgi:hypothetical protein
LTVHIDEIAQMKKTRDAVPVVLLSRLGEIDVDLFVWLKKRRHPSLFGALGSRRLFPLAFVGLADHSINLRSNQSCMSPSDMLAWRAFFR